MVTRKKSGSTKAATGAHPWVPALVTADGVELTLDAAGPVEDHAPLLGGFGGAPIDQLDTQFVLEATHVCRHVRLHRAERRCGPGEGAVFCHGQEGSELLTIHRNE